MNNIKSWATHLFIYLLASIATYGQTLPQDTKTVLITGANRGLGYEFAKQYAEAGYQVIGTARKPEKATELKATGAEVIKLDVTSEEDIAALALALKGRKIDILLNNAGYFGPNPIGAKGDRIDTLTREEIRRCFEINTLGPIFVTQALLPNLKLSPNPKVLNMGSRSGQLTVRARSYGYSISKAALHMATINMHSDLKKEGVIVAALAPGHNKTDMGTDRGSLLPEDSIKKLIPLIESFDKKHSGSLWYYDGKRLSYGK